MSIKISKAKRNNQKKNKLIKSGVIKKMKIKKKGVLISQKSSVQQNQCESEGSDNGEDMLQMVENDDIEYLKKSISNKAYSLLKEIKIGSVKKNKSKTKYKSDDYLEEFERKIEDSLDINVTRVKPMLPIKTKSGIKQCEILIEDNESKNNEPKLVEDELKSESSDEIYENYKSNKNEDLYTFPDNVPISVLDLLFKCQKTYESEKNSISIACAQMIENPEQKIGHVQTICKKIEDNTNNYMVRKFATLSLLEVFIEILPMYFIQGHDMSVKLKKDTLQLYKYEDALLCSYRNYLKKLEKLTTCLTRKHRSSASITMNEQLLAGVAVNCMCELLNTHPYFNYTENIAELLVTLSNSKCETLRILIRDTFKKLFKEDKKAELTLKVMRKINKFVQKVEKHLYPELLESLLSLKIKKVNLDHQIETKNKKKKLMSHKSNILQLSKKERKRKKKLEMLEKELLETKSEENESTINKNITEVTNILFICYFRILKSIENKKILTVTLQGLAKYAHCISIDYFIGILNILSQLMQDKNLKYKDHLYCIQTAFTILINQEDVLNVDLIRFYKYLYIFLIDAPKHSQHVLILTETLRTVLVNQRKKISHDRLLAFTKRLGIISLQLNGEELMNCLKLIRTIIQLSGNVFNCVEHSLNERDGNFLPELDDPDTCNAFFAIMWETTLLQKSYACLTCKVIEYIAKGGSYINNASVEIAKLSNEELEPHFLPSRILENLLYAVHPSNVRHTHNNKEFTQYCKHILKVNKNVL